MHTDLVVIAFVVALAAATYSSWSPCGQSMLSQINPIAERGRGQRFAVTATWFVVGSLIGAAMLGALVAGLAGLVDTLDLSASEALGAAAVVALASAAVDGRVLPWSPPFVRRQVNEDWLPRYRGWVYGVGFGWQIGTGVTTYVMTTAVFAMVAIGALTGDPAIAFGATMLFGLARGLAVFATGRCTSFDVLSAFHRRFDALAPTVRRAVIAVQLAVGVVGATIVWGWAGLAVALAATIAALALVPRLRRTSEAEMRSHFEQPAPVRT